MRKRYSSEFKAKVVLEAVKGELALSVNRQCELLSVNRSSVYYRKAERKEERELEEMIMVIYLEK